MFGYDESRVLHHFTAKFIKGTWSQMEHTFNAIIIQHVFAEFLERGEEHPALHINHAIASVRLQALDSHVHKYGEQVCLRLFIVLLHILTQHLVHITATHIRRIHTDSRIPVRQSQDEMEAVHQGSKGILVSGTLFIAPDAASHIRLRLLADGEPDDAA